MKHRFFIFFMSLGLCCLLVINHSSAQDDLETSSTWFAEVLREWFPQEIPIYGGHVPLNRVMVSNIDLTRFEAKAGKTDIGTKPAFTIKGIIVLDPLPSGFKVINPAPGNRYMLSLQAYLLSPEGKLLWSKRGFLNENSLISVSGITTGFHLISEYNGPIKGCTAAILAIGDSLIINTNKPRVILGMKRFSFRGSSTSTGYQPANVHKSGKLNEADSDEVRAKESLESAESIEITRPDSTLSLIYTVQAGSFNGLDSAHKLYDSIMNELNKDDLNYLRIEKIGQHFAVRIGRFGDQKNAKIFHNKIRSHLSTSRMMKAYIKKERIKKMYPL